MQFHCYTNKKVKNISGLKYLIYNSATIMSSEDELVSKFIDVTGASPDRAKFFMESSNQNLELALARFFEETQDGDITEEVIPRPNSAPLELNEPETANETEPSASIARKGAKKKSSSNFATLFTLNNLSDDDDEEEGQAFYAGGSERSGQQVLGPPKRKVPANDIVQDIFRSAQESGAEVIDRRQAASTSAASNSSLYGGTGYRLGETPEDNVVFQQATRNRPQTIERVVLKLWRTGFSIDNGNLRLYEDPVNSEFLQSIKEGKIPAELQRMAENETVDFEIEDHRHEEYKKPPSKVQTFSGKGHTLGSPAPNVVDEAKTIPGASAENNAENERQANLGLNVDLNQPTTMIQIRLADGSRLSGRFNHTHTVDNIRQFVIAARPAYANQSFNLLMTYPSKELNDGAVTIASAGLLNAAIMQRLK